VPRLLLIVAVLAGAAGCATTRHVGARVQRLSRADGSDLLVLSDEPPGPRRYPLLVYFDGSGCSSAANAAAFLAALKDKGYGFAAPEKRGVRPGDDGSRCTAEYLATNDRTLRVADGRAVIASARRLFPRWDGRLVLAGGSEGAGIAATLAAESRETVALVYLAGGGLEQADELRLMRKKEMLARHASDAEGAATLGELERAFDAIRASPTSQQTWLGADNTFRRWASFLWRASLPDLVRTDVPIFMVHGTRDASVPVESADAIAAEFRRLGKRNLVYWRLDGLDHRWRDTSGSAHARAVLTEVGAWLLATVPPSAER
jgi:pimeloyl-ACP methyl ester carboxylesterase